MLEGVAVVETGVELSLAGVIFGVGGLGWGFRERGRTAVLLKNKGVS